MLGLLAAQSVTQTLTNSYKYSVMMPDKQSRELYLLEKFLPQLFHAVAYSLTQPMPPLPDVVVEVHGRRIGIELTDLIPDESARRMEKLQESILIEAQRVFENKCSLPLHVTVGFSQAINQKGLRIQQLGQQLADIVWRFVEPRKGLAAYQEQFYFQIDCHTNDYFHDVGIFYLNRITAACWSPIMSFWVPTAPTDSIQEIIRRKSRNVPGYLTGCDEVWLLIFETGSPSSYFSYYEQLRGNFFDSTFSRTLIGRIANEELVELRTKQV
jgi:hypothetical protein